MWTFITYGFITLDELCFPQSFSSYHIFLSPAHILYTIIMISIGIVCQNNISYDIASFDINEYTNIKWPPMDDTLEQKVFSKEDEMFWNIFPGNSIQYGSVTDLCSRFWLEIDLAVWMIDSIEVYVLTSRRWIVNSIIESNIYYPGGLI